MLILNSNIFGVMNFYMCIFKYGTVERRANNEKSSVEFSSQTIELVSLRYI